MEIREAVKDDLQHILELLADDPLGSQREQLDSDADAAYLKAFISICADSNQELMVLEDNKKVIGTFQLSFIPYLTYQGGIRAQIEAVRIHKEHRGLGLGEIMIRWAIERGKERGAHLIQLTTDKQRPKAIEFYKNLGFKDSHEGMKLHFK